MKQISIFLLVLGLLTIASSGRAFPVQVQKEMNAKQAVEAWCKQLSKDLRSVVLDTCITRDWQVKADSVEGRPIPFAAYGDPTGRHILVLGGVHGDEISSVSMVFRWMDFLDKVKKDSDLKKNYFIFYPLMNPDGYARRPRKRTNANGVDINRNFPTKQWSEKAHKYWKDRAQKNGRRFPGHEPGSEPETKEIQRVIEAFKPQLIISIHAPYRLVDHDGPIEFPPEKSPLPLRTLGAYPGSLGTFAGVDRNIPVVTPELPTATTMPTIQAIQHLFVFIMKSKF